MMLKNVTCARAQKLCCGACFFFQRGRARPGGINDKPSQRGRCYRLFGCGLNVLDLLVLRGNTSDTKGGACGTRENGRSCPRCER